MARRLIRVFAIVALLLSLAAPVWAGIDKGIAALSLAALRFPPGADRDRAINGRDVVANWLTPGQIAQAKRLAREWTAKHNR